MNKNKLIILIILFLGLKLFSQIDTLPYIQVLGVAQDGGYPHFGCEKECCKQAWKDVSKNVLWFHLH